MGCGPQEEFRACADVTITTTDGSADNTINTLIDPEIYVPEDDTRYNEVDFDETMENYDQQLRDEVQVESVVIIVLCSLLVTVLFFGKYNQAWNGMATILPLVERWFIKLSLVNSCTNLNWNVWLR